MFDNISLRTQYTESDFIKLTDRIGISAPIDSDKVRFYYQNLKFDYYPNSNILNIKNSIHKFYNIELNESLKQPVNYDEFQYYKVLATFHYLVDGLLEKAINEVEVSTIFEYGFNLKIEKYTPFEILSRYQSIVNTHSNEFFTVAPQKGKPIQRTCYFSDWRFKGYDKKKQMGLLNAFNILRLEIVFTELRKIKSVLQKENISVADLCDLNMWLALFNFFLTTYDSIRKIPLLFDTHSDVTNESLYAIYGYSNKLLRDDLKENLTKYYFQNMNLVNKKIYDYYSSHQNNYHNIVRNKIISSYRQLLPEGSSEFQPSY